MNIRLIKKEFKRIKLLGFIKSKKRNNKGLVETFNYYFGLNENNIKDPYFEGFEIKSQKFLSAKIALFIKSPTYPEKATQYLCDKYGVSDIVFKKMKTFLLKIYCNRFNDYSKKYSFKLEKDKTRKKLFFIVKNLSNKKITKEDIYYTLDDIIGSTKKLDKLIVLTADTKINRGNQFFHYQSATLYSGFKLDKFLNLLKRGKVHCKIRIGLDRIGTKLSKLHDHGCEFRIYRNNLKDLYDNIFEIK